MLYFFNCCSCTSIYQTKRTSLVCILSFFFNCYCFLSFFINLHDFRIFAGTLCNGCILLILLHLSFFVGVRMHVEVTRKQYHPIKKLGKITMSAGIIAFHQLMQVCQVIASSLLTYSHLHLFLYSVFLLFHM